MNVVNPIPLMNQSRLEVGDYWFFIIDKVLQTRKTYNVLRGDTVILSVSYNKAASSVIAKFFHNGDYTITGFNIDHRRNYSQLVWDTGNALEAFVTSLGVSLLNTLIMDEGNYVNIPPFELEYQPGTL